MSRARTSTSNIDLPELAARFVEEQVAVLVTAGGTSAALAAKAATATVPIVFAIGADPVQIGLVASLNRPGGNVTGATSINVELGPKRLELMRELLPSVSSMALLVNPTTPALAEPSTRITQAAAHALGLELHVAAGARRARFRSDVCKDRGIASTSTDYCTRPALHRSQQAAGRANPSACAARNL